MVDDEPPAPAARGELGLLAACCAARRLWFHRRAVEMQEVGSTCRLKSSEDKLGGEWSALLLAMSMCMARSGMARPLTGRLASFCSPGRRGWAVRQLPLRQTAGRVPSYSGSSCDVHAPDEIQMGAGVN
jgi:hypothetical protein